MAISFLSDALDLPNLWREARATLTRQLDRLFFVKPTLTHGDDQSAARLPEPVRFCFPSSIKQWYSSSCSHDLYMSAECTLGTSGHVAGGHTGRRHSIETLNRSVQFAFNTNRRQNLRWLPAFALIALLSVLIGLAWIPFSYSIRVPVLFQMNQYTPVTIIEAGTLIDTLPEGTRVAKGQAIAHLASTKLELELVARQGELSRQSSKLFTLQVETR